MSDTLGIPKSKWNFVPILYSQPEIGVGFGIRAIRVFRDRHSNLHNRPSTIPYTLIYTTKKQTIINSRSDLWLKNDTYHFSHLLGYQNYPFQFYGIGNDTPLSAKELYTTRIVESFLAFEKRILKGVFIGARYEFKNEKTIRKEPNKLLDLNQVTGSEGQLSSGLGLTATYDTRNSIYQPTKGSYNQLSAIFFTSVLGSRSGFTRYRADIRQYFRTFAKQVLALQAQFTFNSGKVPFQQLAQIGGPDLMRGYFQGRYRDKDMMVYQAEYRLPIKVSYFDRFSWVAFGSAGQVAQNVTSFSFDSFRYAGGLGIRYRYNPEGLTIRLDVGLGQSTYFYFAFNEAF